MQVIIQRVQLEACAHLDMAHIAQASIRVPAGASGRRQPHLAAAAAGTRRGVDDAKQRMAS